jgi:DNA-directed RNA polymerase specialized sigma24 family protein
MLAAAAAVSMPVVHPAGAPVPGCCRLARAAGASHCAALFRSADRDAACAGARLAQVVELLWPEVHALMRRAAARGLDPEDLTQAYFTRFIEKGTLRQLESWHGCRRPFLSTSVRNFVANARDRARAAKRGGRLRRVSIDRVPDLAAPSLLPRDAASPEALLLRAERRRAVAHAVGVVRAQMGEGRRRPRFEALLRLIVDGGDARDLARAWGVRPVAVRVAAHRLRRRLAAVVTLRSQDGADGRPERTP